MLNRAIRWWIDHWFNSPHFVTHLLLLYLISSLVWQRGHKLIDITQKSYFERQLYSFSGLSVTRGEQEETNKSETLNYTGWDCDCHRALSWHRTNLKLPPIKCDFIRPYHWRWNVAVSDDSRPGLINWFYGTWKSSPTPRQSHRFLFFFHLRLASRGQYREAASRDFCWRIWMNVKFTMALARQRSHN